MNKVIMVVFILALHFATVAQAADLVELVCEIHSPGGYEPFSRQHVPPSDRTIQIFIDYKNSEVRLDGKYSTPKKATITKDEIKFNNYVVNRNTGKITYYDSTGRCAVATQKF